MHRDQLARTAFGAPLDPNERVVFAHVPPPPSGGERAIYALIGVFFLPIVVGIFIIIYAFMMKSDRAWFVTNQRIVNVKSNGKVHAMQLGDITFAAVKRSSSTVEMGIGMQSVVLPAAAQVQGQPLLTLMRTPMAFAALPTIDVPA